MRIWEYLYIEQEVFKESTVRLCFTISLRSKNCFLIACEINKTMRTWNHENTILYRSNKILRAINHLYSKQLMHYICLLLTMQRVHKRQKLWGVIPLSIAYCNDVNIAFSSYAVVDIQNALVDIQDAVVDIQTLFTSTAVTTSNFI